MNEVQFRLDKAGDGAFIITDSGETLGEMKVGISGSNLTIYHTEVLPKVEGKGLGKKLLAAVVKHARNHALKVKTLCIFVYGQFKKNPEEYSDIWQKA